MTRFDYWKCDECGKILENCECLPNQLMFTLIANYDNDSGKAHFCSQKCLLSYVTTKVKDHHDLPIISDGGRTSEMQTIGEVNLEKEKPENYLHSNNHQPTGE
jgi:hypothetical protein